MPQSDDEQRHKCGINGCAVVKFFADSQKANLNQKAKFNPQKVKFAPSSNSLHQISLVKFKADGNLKFKDELRRQNPREVKFINSRI